MCWWCALFKQGDGLCQKPWHNSVKILTQFQNLDTIIKSQRHAICLFDFTLCFFVRLSLSLSFSFSLSLWVKATSSECCRTYLLYTFIYSSALMRSVKRGGGERGREWWQGFWSSQWSSLLTGFCCHKIEVIISQHKSGSWNWFSWIVMLKETCLLWNPQHSDK